MNHLNFGWHQPYLWINWVKVLCPTRHRIGHFGNVLSSQSLGLALNHNQSPQRLTLEASNFIAYTKYIRIIRRLWLTQLNPNQCLVELWFGSDARSVAAATKAKHRLRRQCSVARGRFTSLYISVGRHQRFCATVNKYRRTAQHYCRNKPC